MKYGDVILQSMRNMFLNNDNIEISDLATMKADKKYKIYMDGIHLTINEAISILLNQCQPYIKTVSVTPDYALSSASDFIRVSQIFDSNDNEMSYEIVNNKLKIPHNGTMYYEASYKVADDTSYDLVLPIPTVLTQLIPLYVAGERYKDDDLTLATTYLNEFEMGMQRVRNLASKIEMTTDLYGGF